MPSSPTLPAMTDAREIAERVAIELVPAHQPTFRYVVANKVEAALLADRLATRKATIEECARVADEHAADSESDNANRYAGEPGTIHYLENEACTERARSIASSIRSLVDKAQDKQG